MFVVYSEPIEIVWRLYISFYLSHYPIRDESFNRRYQQMEIFTSIETMVDTGYRSHRALEFLFGG